MRATFHGVRGSAPLAGAKAVRYGGDTPCVEVEAGGRRILLDAGSGMRHVRLGDAREFDLVLSHYHVDHLIGLFSFRGAFRPDVRLRIWAPRFEGRAPQEILQRFYAPPFAPVPLAGAPMKAEIRPYAPGEEWTLGPNLCVRTALLDHPGGCAGIRIDAGAGGLVYATDVELAATGATETLARFAEDVDLLIVDAMSSDQEAEARRGWGHSTWREAVAAGVAARAGRIALFHHDPERDDDALDAFAAEAARIAPQALFARQHERIAVGSLTGRPERDSFRTEKGESLHGNAAGPLLPRPR